MEKITLETAKTGSRAGILKPPASLGVARFWLSWWSSFAFIRCHL